MAYNFQEKNGNVEIYENGQRISTATPDYARSAYGYGGTAPVIATDTLTQGRNAIDVPNYGGLSSQDLQSTINAAIAGANTPVPVAEARPEDTTQQTIDAMMAQAGIIETKPSSGIDYWSRITGLTPEQVATQKAESQRKFNDLNAQMAALTAEAGQLKLREQAIPIEQAQAGIGGTTSMRGVKALSEIELRKNALKSLDLAYRTLPISAQLNAEKGNLDAANANIQTLLGLYEKDQQATKEWNQNMYERAKAQATREQQAKIDAWKDRKDAEDEAKKELLDLKKTYIAESIKQGDYNSAARISAAKTTEEVNVVGRGIKAKAQIWSEPYLMGNSYVQKNAETGEIRQAVSAVSTPTKYIPGSNPTVDNWAKLIIAGQAKISEVPNPKGSTLRSEVIDAITNSGQLILSDKDREKLSTLDTAFNVYDTIKGLSEKINTFDVIGRVTGWAKRYLGGLTQYNVDIARYNTAREGFVSNVARTLGEKGTLAEGDVQRAISNLPTVNDTKAVAEGKLETLKSILEGSRNSIIQKSTQDVRELTPGTLVTGGQSSTTTPESLRTKYNY